MNPERYNTRTFLRLPMPGEFDPNHVCRDNPGDLQHRPHGGAGYTDFIPLAGCIDMERDELLTVITVGTRRRVVCSL